MAVEAIQRIGKKIRVIEQSKLPLAFSYLELDDYRDVIAAIRRLDVRGAPAIGIAAAYALALAVEKAADFALSHLERAADEVKAARPTAVNLAWAVDRVMRRVRQAPPLTRREALAILWEEAEAIHDEDRRLCERIGQYGADLIKPGDGILTHCNAGALATGGKGTALAVIYAAQEAGKRPRVYADETRPLLQGARLTAWELLQAGVDVTLICDSAAATVLRQGKVQHVIVGADRIARNGDAANKIGTYPLAVLAARHGVPFCVAAPYSTFDENTAAGEQIPIEERAADEVTGGFGRRTAPEGVKVYSPAFDVTPFQLVTYYITDQGIKPG
ncbi:MAG TPA: S-methyl-5-thioribose-1-phosphate isomerase, partial [candidate division Zixibacteria bacterium]|nr:S-methyl-5-thioribose-1-phosphate isomerase [candidate division Zixibacteria bacterium]